VLKMSADQRQPLRLTFELDHRTRLVAAAERGLSAEEISEAGRLLRAGEPATDPRVARLVVALAQQERRGDLSLLFLWYLSLGLALWALIRLVGYPWNDLTLAAVLAALASGGMTRRTTRVRLRFPLAERRNTELLQAFGLDPTTAAQPPTEPETTPTAGPLTALARTAPGFVLVGLSTSVADSLLDHRRIAVAHVLVAGLAFGALGAALHLARAWYRAQGFD
jgi:hypothetical protein